MIAIGVTLNDIIEIKNCGLYVCINVETAISNDRMKKRD